MTELERQQFRQEAELIAELIQRAPSTDATRTIRFLCNAVMELTQNPWRYPSRGEWPEKRGYYLVSDNYDVVDRDFWDGRRFRYARYQRAWRNLPEPAPELEVEG